MRDSGEDALVRRLVKAWPSLASHRLALGPGHDCAVIQGDRAVTTDLLLEGVHFRLDWATPEEVGAKALAVNLSDLAACGALPAEVHIGLALSKRHPLAVADGLYRGMAALAKEWNMALAGGDTCLWEGPLVLAIHAAGIPPPTPLIRSGARQGDRIYVSGTLGDSAYGLSLLMQHGRDSAGACSAGAVSRHLSPIPRLSLGRALAERHLATACMDLSDGLAQDLPRLCRASGVGARVEASWLPRGAAVSSHLQALSFCLEGGEEYELLFTSSLDPGMIQELSRELDLPLTEIGEITPAAMGLNLWTGTEIAPLAEGGWDPFRGG